MKSISNNILSWERKEHVIKQKGTCNKTQIVSDWVVQSPNVQMRNYFSFKSIILNFQVWFQAQWWNGKWGHLFKFQVLDQYFW